MYMLSTTEYARAHRFTLCQQHHSMCAAVRECQSTVLTQAKATYLQVQLLLHTGLKHSYEQRLHSDIVIERHVIERIQAQVTSRYVCSCYGTPVYCTHTSKGDIPTNAAVTVHWSNTLIQTKVT